MVTSVFRGNVPAGKGRVDRRGLRLQEGARVRRPLQQFRCEQTGLLCDRGLGEGVIRERCWWPGRLAPRTPPPQDLATSQTWEEGVRAKSTPTCGSLPWLSGETGTRGDAAWLGQNGMGSVWGTLSLRSLRDPGRRCLMGSRIVISPEPREQIEL